MKKVLSPRDQVYSEDVFEVLMNYEILRTIRYPTPLSLLYLEATPRTSDGQAPPSVFQIFEAILNTRLRAVDIPTRHGRGYLILLPATNEAGARLTCERLLAIFDQELETEEGSPVRFSLQIGVASHDGGPTVMKETLLRAAEQSLKRSRQMGANTISTIYVSG